MAARRPFARTKCAVHLFRHSHCIFTFREVILRHIVGNNRAAFKADDTLCALREIEIMRDEHQSRSRFTIQFEQ